MRSNERAARVCRVHAIAVLACIAGAGLARAQSREGRASAISVRGASSCVTAPQLRGRIARYLAVQAPPELAIEVDLAGDPPGFRVLRAGAPIAERRFDRLPAGCAERRDAIALTIAVAIEHALPAADRAALGASPPSAASATPDATRSSSSPPVAATTGAETTAASPAPASQPSGQAAQASAAPAPAQPRAAEPDPGNEREDEEPTQAEPELNETEEETADPPSPPWQRPTERWMLHAGATYLLEALPAPVPVFSLGAEFAPLPAFRLSLAGLASTETTIDFSSGNAVGQLFGGSVVACLNTPFYFVIVHGCAGVSAAATRARAEADAFDEVYEAVWLPWVAGVLRLVLEVPSTSRLAVRLAGAGHVNWARPKLIVEGTRESQSAAPAGASLSAEILWRVK